MSFWDLPPILSLCFNDFPVVVFFVLLCAVGSPTCRIKSRSTESNCLFFFLTCLFCTFIFVLFLLRFIYLFFLTQTTRSCPLDWFFWLSFLKKVPTLCSLICVRHFLRIFLFIPYDYNFCVKKTNELGRAEREKAQSVVSGALSTTVPSM